MKVVLLDTNIVSILFNRNHSLHPVCAETVTGHNLVICFMTQAELMLWPVANNWGVSRRVALDAHRNLYTTLFPDEQTCRLWAELVDQRRRIGKIIQTADPWITATALQWNLPLVTTDFRDYAAISDLKIIPIE
jgi:predicted nucleic acid-binding protein